MSNVHQLVFCSAVSFPIVICRKPDDSAESVKLWLIFSYKSHSSWELEDLGLDLWEQFEHKQEFMEVSAEVCIDFHKLWISCHVYLRKEANVVVPKYNFTKPQH